MAEGQFYAVILAGGRGTRFWPRSRRETPKQLLPVVGETSLLQQTVARLEPLIPAERIWIFTSDLLREKIIEQLPAVPPEQVVAEPVQRNTAPCIAMAARLLAERDPDAVMGVFPSDHLIEDETAYLEILRSAAEAARSNKELVVLGIEPRWAETGYGYIEYPAGTVPGSYSPSPVVQFREKPDRQTAQQYVDAGNFCWNSGMFVWKASTLLAAVAQYMPQTASALCKLPPFGAPNFASSLAEHYAACDNLSIDYGVLEKASNIVGFSCADFGWNDVGSWEAVYTLADKDGVSNAPHTPIEAIDASGNYVDAPGKLVALVGVDNLVVVDTLDALLICPREKAQQVSAVVKALAASGREDLL